MDLYDHKEINGWPVNEYVNGAANAFTAAALDDITWAGDEVGTGENPLQLGAYTWAPVIASDVAEAWSDPADSPETQVENALGNPRAIEIVNTLNIKPQVFGDRLYYDQNGSGTGFCDMGYPYADREALYRELSDLIGYHAWQVEYSYDPLSDPDGDNLTLNVYT